MEQTLLQASEEWVAALTRAVVDLDVASKRIQEEFAAAKNRAESSGQEAIPDLPDIIRRVQCLENSLIHLQQTSNDIANQRKTVLSNAYQEFQKNQRLLSMLSDHLKITEPVEECSKRQFIEEQLRNACS